MITVISGTINDGINDYKPGDIISGLSVEDEIKLVEYGVAELMPDFIEAEEVETDDEDSHPESDEEADTEEEGDADEGNGPDTSLPGLEVESPKTRKR